MAYSAFFITATPQIVRYISKPSTHTNVNPFRREDALLLTCTESELDIYDLDKMYMVTAMYVTVSKITIVFRL